MVQRLRLGSGLPLLEAAHDTYHHIKPVNALSGSTGEKSDESGRMYMSIKWRREEKDFGEWRPVAGAPHWGLRNGELEE